MENLIIQKSVLKFVVEVTTINNQLNFNVTRFIEVGKFESLDTNAKLAKNDALKIGGQFINCNALMKSALDGMQAKTLPYSLNLKTDRKIRLKKTCHFGY